MNSFLWSSWPMKSLAKVYSAWSTIFTTDCHESADASRPNLTDISSADSVPTLTQNDSTSSTTLYSTRKRYYESMLALAQKYTHPRHLTPHVKMITPQECVQEAMPSEDEDDKDFYAALQKTLTKKKYNGMVSKSHPVLGSNLVPSSPTKMLVQKQDSKMDFECPQESFLAIEKPSLITSESLHTMLPPCTTSEWNISRRHSSL